MRPARPRFPLGRRRAGLGLAAGLLAAAAVYYAAQAPAAAPSACAQPAAGDAGPAACQTCAPAGGWPTPAGAAPVCAYTVVRTFPHDPQAFTQGLVYLEGELYEGTGLNGRSELRRVALTTGAVVQRAALPAEHFGEGVAVLGDRIFQLTWQSRIGFVYERASLQLRQTFAYETEGWGLTHDGRRLIMSDGTAALYFLDPATLRITGQVAVSDQGQPVTRLNELEYIHGLVYANVWQTDRIARIDPDTGRVVSWLDLAGLLPAADRAQPVDVLNGIAYDAAGDRLFVTGKLWPTLFEITLRAQP